MGTEKRTKSFNKGVPGPGQYTYSSKIGNGPKYSMASKSGAIDYTKFVVSPGPGNYTPNFESVLKTQNKFSIRSRPNTAKASITPGPGNYSIRTDKGNLVPACK